MTQFGGRGPVLATEILSIFRRFPLDGAFGDANATFLQGVTKPYFLVFAGDLTEQLLLSLSALDSAVTPRAKTQICKQKK